ncbi:MAG: triphosphoribosyl-dephospho-CoA synthase [Prevotella sp.]|nr:triphosphoribosyl-dephospho-CoA synthase [Prevotella sp.]
MVDYEIHSVPMSMPLWRRKVERFLETNQLRLDEVDYYAIVTEPDGDDILAGGGLQGDIIKCIAVSEQLRDAHLSNRLISHLISEAAQRGHHSVKVFTKPQNRQVFESLGFRLVGEAPLAILMENGHGIDDYTKYLRSCASTLQPAEHPADISLPTGEGWGGASTVGVIVMNANPFTLGHKYLIEKAAAEVDHLFIIPVKEERSLFPYAERKAMIEQSLSTLNSPLSTKNGAVLSGSDYAISAATFPTYFLKQLSDAADTQMLLDIDIFCRHIAPALGATVRFVGSEPTDALTRRYNELLAEQLPKHGLRLKEIPRLQTEQTPISATTVRSLMAQGMFVEATKLVPPTTIPYLLAHLACDALQQELDTTPKPGLVDQHDSGAHADMDYRLMQRSIRALRPYFVQLAQVAQQGQLTHPVISAIGIEAERAMLAATGGVNTHRGALFSMGLAIVASGSSLSEHSEYSENSEYSEYSEYSEHSEHSDNSELSERPTPSSLQSAIAQLAQTFPDTQGTHGSRAVSQYQAKGALAMAREGYEQLFSDWLPFLRNLKQQGDPYAHHKTLLRIMSQLDDTNILHRCGAEVASRVKAEAADMLAHFSTDALDDMNRRYSAENISPGGSADMLALTIFTNAIMTR